jgi:hypothetical protein
VVPVPDSARAAALEFARVMGVKYREPAQEPVRGPPFIMAGRPATRERPRQATPLPSRSRAEGPPRRRHRARHHDPQVVHGADAGAKAVYLAVSPHQSTVRVRRRHERATSSSAPQDDRQDRRGRRRRRARLHDHEDGVRREGPTAHPPSAWPAWTASTPGDITPAVLRTIDRACARRPNEAPPRRHRGRDLGGRGRGHRVGRRHRALTRPR